jgi:segregation and condensation protein A
MENLTFHLEGIVKSKDEMQDFTGPLSLILMLLSKNKIEIRDLNISEILEQYLNYIAKMQEMDLDIASEFVQMASHLIYIKTRTLLVGDEEEVSEIEELMNSLEQLKCHDAYMSVKAVTSELSKLAETGLQMFSKLPEPLATVGDNSYRYSHEPSELLVSLLSVLTRAGAGSDIERIGVPVSKHIIFGVREKCEQLINLLKSGNIHTLKELYLMSHSRSEVIATFIAVLELCSTGSLEIKETDGELAVSLSGEVPEILTELISD